MKKKIRYSKKFSLKEEYLKNWDFLKESKKFIYFVVLFFIIFFFIGFFLPAPESLNKWILEFVSGLLEKTENMGFLELFGFILLNNMQSGFFSMMLGSFFGILPLLSIIANGYLVGFVSSMAVQEAGFNSLWRLFPHGIFELPAVFISFGLGIKFGTFIFKKNKKDAFKEYLINCLRVFIFVIIPLLIIAAIIESSLIIFLG
ncbi:MAG TPA: stage II sporulation protein M [Candidatus Nanoarchaeia archaeon]|nr:stage II sporulation protein M [Candidatus Nanoarchaeia archaeon]